MSRLLANCLAVFVVSAIAFAADNAKSIVATMNQSWLAAYAAADFERLAAAYTEDGILMPTGREPIYGREAIKKFFAEDFKYVPKRSMKVKSLRVEGAGEVLVDSGEYTFDGIDTEGKSLHITGNYNTVMKKTEGKWHTVVEIWNVRTPEESK